jgi:hypothetical protein
VTFSATVDDEARAILSEALAEYNGQTKSFKATLLPAGSAEGDLVLSPAKEGGTLWRSLGWKIWARLERLAAIEGDLGRSLIIPLREGRMDVGEFESTLGALRAKGVVAIVMPHAPSLYSWALEQYLGKLGGDAAARKDEWSRKGWLVEVPDLRAAVDAINRNKAVFLMGSDTVAGFLGRTPESHPEGFPLPGSRAVGASWVLGRGEAFSVPQGSLHKAGALDLLVYLTSKGLSRRFAQELPGDFYFWTKPPASGALPDVGGPTEFRDPEPR